MVKRYNIYDAPPSTEQEKNGEWVKYEDYSSLESRHRDLVAALQKIANGEGYYGAMANEYKTIAKQALAKEKDSGLQEVQSISNQL